MALIFLRKGLPLIKKHTISRMILFLMLGLIMLTMTVSGDPAPVVANFTAIPGSGEAPLTVTFTVHFIIFGRTTA
jgi:hypothetical protein